MESSSKFSAERRSYLLHIWQERTDSSVLWRASLTEVESGRRSGFATTDAALLYLLEQVMRLCSGVETG